MKNLYAHTTAARSLIRLLVCFAAVLLLFVPSRALAAEADDVKPDNGIPVVYINIDEDQGTIADMLASPDHSVYCYGTISIDVPEGFHYCDFPDSACESVKNLAMSIRGRGNSTWTYEENGKRPFKVKLDKKADLFGLGKNKHWALLANVYDPTLIRNRITGWLGEQMGLEFTPRGVPVDLVMTGSKTGSSYLGSYYFTETVRIDKNRIEIDELEETDTDAQAITGGYLLQGASQSDPGDPNIIHTEKGDPWILDTPYFDDEYQNQAQFDYIKNYILDFEKTLMSGSLSYRDQMDITSAARYWLASEFPLNDDRYTSGSTYIYKTRDTDQGPGKIFWGPLWDYDLAYGNFYTDYDQPVGITHDWVKALMHDKKAGGFIKEISKQWPVMKSALLDMTSDGGIIDQYYQETKASAKENYKLYDPDPAAYGREEAFSYKTSIKELKAWIRNRISYFDEILPELKNLVYQVQFLVDGGIYQTDFLTNFEYLGLNVKQPEKDGYTFMGWEDENGDLVNLDDAPEKDRTLTARFAPDDQVTHAKKIVFKQDVVMIPYDPDFNDYTIESAVIPTSAQDKNIKWSSSDESVATVDEKGTVSIHAPGTVIITGSLKFGESRQLKLIITEDYFEAPESISPETDTIRMNPGDQKGLTIKSDPPAKAEFIDYITEDESVVRIDDSCVLTAVGYGKTRVRIEGLFKDAYDDMHFLETYVDVIVPWPESMRVSITKAKMADVPTKVYTGSPIKPGVTIKYGGRTLKKGTDYKLTWSSNTNPGMGKIKITGIGQFKGSKTVSFKIIPRPTRIKSVTALKKGFNVTWCKRTKQITGYSIKWSTSAGMKNAKYNTIRNNQTVSLKKTGLKPGTTYYIQVRTYKEVNGVKYYSRWSAKQKVTTKR